MVGLQSTRFEFGLVVHFCRHCLQGWRCGAATNRGGLGGLGPPRPRRAFALAPPEDARGEADGRRRHARRTGDKRRALLAVAVAPAGGLRRAPRGSDKRRRRWCVPCPWAVACGAQVELFSDYCNCLRRSCSLYESPLGNEELIRHTADHWTAARHRNRTGLATV